MKTTINVTIDGNQLVANAKQFSTGSVGFGANGKVVIDGERYQVSLNIVKIGSKPVALKTKSRKAA
jgi:hypothetical protein